jgi:hypothetical protein
VSYKPVPHVNDVRDFNPALIDHLATLDGNMVLEEIAPHRDMDSDPVRHTPHASWNVHFEGLLPGVAGQRFYGQMWDGWTWSIWRGQVVGAGSFMGEAISETPSATFIAEMRRWGVRHLLVWTDASRDYLSGAGAFVERWRDGVWSDFELQDADVRSVTVAHGAARLDHLDPFGADVELNSVATDDIVVVRTNFYPAWQAEVANRAVPLFSSDGQLAFKAPADGTYIVKLEYPRRLGLSILALVTFVLGLVGLGYSTPGIPGGVRT